MADLQVRSDSVDVEQIMRQIRTRIREKRGSDYTEAELQQLASVKLEQFADPSGLKSDLLEQFRKRGNEPSTYHRHRGPRRWLLMLLHPVLKRVQKQVMSDLNLYLGDHPQPGGRGDAPRYRGPEPEDEGRVVIEPRGLR